MTYRGHIKNGMVVLDGDQTLPEGCTVRVEVLDTPAQSEASWSAALRELDGAAEGLPPDASVNHDHYLYGTSKRSA